MKQVLRFDLSLKGDSAAGFMPVSEEISVTLENGGWDGEMLEDLETDLLDLFQRFFECGPQDRVTVIRD